MDFALTTHCMTTAARLAADLADSGCYSFFGPPSILEIAPSNIAARLTTEHVHIVHQGFMPEIEVLGETSAFGVWAMRDELWDQARKLILTGNGHYHETYERSAGGWTIKTLRLVRLSLLFGEGRRSDPVTRTAMPGAPPNRLVE